MKNETLINELTAQTQILREEYIAKTREYASEMFSKIEKIAARPHPEYADFATPNFSGNGIDYAQGKSYHKACDARYSAQMTVNRGFEAYEAKLVELAERHYTDSIIKLAARIEKKGLDQSNITIKTARVGVNIETTLTDGTQTVRAWTIIASGPCVRPHYRYLIK